MLPSPPGLKPDYVSTSKGMQTGILASTFVMIVLLLVWGSSHPEYWHILLLGILGFDLLFVIVLLVKDHDQSRGQTRLLKSISQKLNLQGHEHLLVAGCGRGFLLLNLAKQLTTGRAEGIDTWHLPHALEDAITTTEENARREGVVEKVAVHSGDFRELPFSAEAFDAVIICWIDSFYDPEKSRGNVLPEFWRVLKPGGRLLILSSKKQPQHQETLQKLGCKDIHQSNTGCTYLSPTYQRWAVKP